MDVFKLSCQEVNCLQAARNQLLTPYDECQAEYSFPAVSQAGRTPHGNQRLTSFSNTKENHRPPPEDIFSANFFKSIPHETSRYTRPRPHLQFARMILKRQHKIPLTCKEDGLGLVKGRP